MKKLSRAATDIARVESSGRKEVRRRLRALFAEAEALSDPARSWRFIREDKRRHLIAYLADDCDEFPEHKPANLACIAMLLRAENGGRVS